MALRLFTEGMDTLQIWAIKRYLASKGKFRQPNCGSKAVPVSNKRGPNRGRRVITWGWAVVVVLVFVFIHFLAVWSYGDGFYPLLWFTYVCFNTWNTADIVSLRVLNAPLLGPEETEMGFGQVLPLVLMGDILFHIVGVFRGKFPCDRRKEGILPTNAFRFASQTAQGKVEASGRRINPGVVRNGFKAPRREYGSKKITKQINNDFSQEKLCM